MAGREVDWARGKSAAPQQLSASGSPERQLAIDVAQPAHMPGGQPASLFYSTSRPRLSAQVIISVLAWRTPLQTQVHRVSGNACTKNVGEGQQCQWDWAK